MNRMKHKTVLDIALTLLLGAQMAYSLISEVSHEISGLCMVALLALHHALNGSFHSRLFKGRYTPYRIALTVINVAMLIIFLTQASSGLVMAKHVRLFNMSAANLARTAHLPGAYWGFVLCGVHAGLHTTGLLRRWLRMKHRSTKAVVAVIVLVLLASGIMAFIRRGLPDYMTLRQQFVFFDYGEPLVYFFIDYVLMLFMFTIIGCIAGYGLQSIKGRKRT